MESNLMIGKEVSMPNQNPYRALWQGRILFTLVIAAFIFSPFAPVVAAEEKPDAQSDWEFQAAPYFWALSMDGDVTVKGRKADVDVSFSDIWDELNIALMLEYEARKGNWGLWGNTIYADLGGSDTHAGPLTIEPTATVLWQGAGGSYRMGTWDLADSSGKHTPSVTVDTYFGIRYTYLDVDLDIKGLDDIDKSEDWLEPLVGVRTLWNLSERWSVNLAGDIGGVAFGSDFAWSAFGLIGYRFSLFGEDNANAIAGYRALSQDYSDGHGSDKFEWDITLHGPVLGLVITF
jgi:hypothetical protein